MPKKDVDFGHIWRICDCQQLYWPWVSAVNKGQSWTKISTDVDHVWVRHCLLCGSEDLCTLQPLAVLDWARSSNLAPVTLKFDCEEVASVGNENVLQWHISHRCSQLRNPPLYLSSIEECLYGGWRWWNQETTCLPGVLSNFMLTFSLHSSILSLSSLLHLLSLLYTVLCSVIWVTGKWALSSPGKAIKT